MMQVVADVGATNTRLAFVNQAGEVGVSSKFETSNFDGPVDAIYDFCKTHKQKMPQKVCLGVAAPVFGDVINLTNNSWTFSIHEAKSALGLDELMVINNMLAWGFSLLRVDEQNITQIGGGYARPQGMRCVLVPGSGLGVAGMLPFEGRWVPIVSESGYIELCGDSTYRYEQEILASVRARHGRVSAERLLSGSGLQELFAAVVKARNLRFPLPTSEEITRRAVKGDCKYSMTAAELYISLMGEFAGTMALAYGALGGVYIAGNIADALWPLVKKSRFHERFLAKGRGSKFVDDIPCFWINGATDSLCGLAQVITAGDKLQGSIRI